MSADYYEQRIREMDAEMDAMQLAGERDEGPADFPDWSLSKVLNRLEQARTSELLNLPPRTLIRPGYYDELADLAMAWQR